MANKKAKPNNGSGSTEKDAVYFLKLVLFLLLGSLWLQFGSKGMPIPVGLVFGLLLASQEHFQIDRKIEYAVLLVSAVVSYATLVGFILNIG